MLSIALRLPGLLPAPARLSGCPAPTLHCDFYFDTVSPYTWPAFEVLVRYQERWRLNIHYKPVFLGGLTAAASKPGLSYFSELISCAICKSINNFVCVVHKCATICQLLALFIIEMLDESFIAMPSSWVAVYGRKCVMVHSATWL